MAEQGSERPLVFNFVTTFYPPYHFGGDAIFVYYLANALARRGHQINVVHCADTYAYLARRAPAGEFPNHPNITVHTLRHRLGPLSPIVTYATGLPALKSGALRAVLDRPADVTHFHNASLIGGPGVLSYGRGVKLYTAHDHWLVCPTHVLWKFDREPCERKECFRCTLHSGRPPQLWRYTPLLRQQLRHLDLLISPSEFSRRRHAELGIRTEVLPYFVPAPLPAAATGHQPPPPRPYVAFVGRLEKIKGILWLIEALRSYQDLDLLVAGEGSDDQVVRAAAADLPQVHVLGRLGRTQLAALYQHALAVVVPSLCYEVLGLVAVEALSYGSPIIVRDLGPLPDLVEKSRAGMTFREPTELVAALERLRREPGLRQELGRRAREDYLARWTEERHLERYFAFIDELSAARSADKPSHSCSPRSRPGGASS